MADRGIAEFAGRRRGAWLRRLVVGGALLLLPAAWAPPAARAATLAVCQPGVTADVDRSVLPLGETVGLSLTLDPRCGDVPERRHLELVLQASGDAAADRKLGEALAGLVDTLPADFGNIGLVSGDGLTPSGMLRELPPTTDRAKVRAALRAFGGGGNPQDLDVLLKAARAVYLPPNLNSPKMVGRRHIVMVGNAAAAVGRAQTLDLEAVAARSDAIELLRYCLGSGCSPLPWTETVTVADAAALTADLGARMQRLALPALATVRLSAVYGASSAYVFKSAQPPASIMGLRYGQATAPYIGWDLVDQKEPVSLTWRLRPLERAPAVVALNFMVLEGVTTSGESISQTLAGERLINTQTQPPLPSACHLRAQASAPGRVGLDDGFTLGLRLQTECPGGPQAADVVLVVDRSASMATGSRTQELNKGLRSFLEAVNLDLHRVALIDMQTTPRLSVPLSQDRAALLAAASATRPAGETGMGEALDLARKVLDGRRDGALPVTLLLTDGQGSFPRPGADDPWFKAGAWLQLEGVSTFVACLTGPEVCNPRLGSIASGPAWLRHTPQAVDLEAALLEMAARLGEPSLRSVTVRYDLQGAFYHSDPNGGDDPDYLHERGKGLKTVPRPLVGPLEITTPVWARAVGPWPVTDLWEAVWVDSDGRVGTAAIPPPVVDVQAPPDEGPCRATAVTRQVDPTDAALDGTVRTRTAATLTCQPERQDLELVLVLDHSDSMRGQRILDLRSGVDRLLADSAATAGLRIGLVAFSEQVLTSRPLGTEPAEIKAALAATDPHGITNIGLGLSAAAEMLQLARPGSRRLVFLLTDGRNSLGTDSLVAAADRLKGSEQNEIAALCLAAACDSVLSDIVSRPGYYADLSDSGQLASFFHRLATAVTGRAPMSADLRDQTGAALVAEPGSALPPTTFEPDPHVWQLPFLGDSALDVGLSLTARWPGRQPVTLWTRLDYRLVGGQQGRLYLQPLAVTVPDTAPPAPTAGPLLTPTMAPPTRTPEATSTATRFVVRVLLPWLTR